MNSSKLSQQDTYYDLFIESNISSKNFLLQEGFFNEMSESFYNNLIISSYQIYNKFGKREKKEFCIKLKSLFSDLKKEELYLIIKDMKREHIRFLFYILSEDYDNDMSIEEKAIYY